MSKLKEKHINAELQSVQDTGEKNTGQLEQKQFLEEAEAIEREIENIPDRDEWESTEEKFQRLMKKARERGLIQEAHLENAIDDKDDIEKKSEKITSEKLNMENNHAEKRNSKTKFSSIRRKVIKRSAVAAAVVFGIFGFTMTSEANRAYIMQKIDKMMGNHTRTELDNNKTLVNDNSEEIARAEIEEALQVKLPQFFYLPDGMVYDDYILDVEGQAAIIQYTYEENANYLVVFANVKNTTRIATSDSGEEIGKVKSQFMDNVEADLWEVLEEGDEKATYILQWEFKNSYYEFVGKVSDKEIKTIGEKTLF